MAEMSLMEDRLQLLDVPLHTSALQLEHVGGLARGEEVEGLLIVEAQLVEVYLNPPGSLSPF